jgi:hypothetical protein
VDQERVLIIEDEVKLSPFGGLTSGSSLTRE